MPIAEPIAALEGPPRAGAMRLTVRQIARAVATAASVPVEDLYSRRHDRYAVTVRWAVMRLARRNGRTLAEIGRVLNRDHTTVLYGLQVSQRVGNYAPDRARLLAAIEDEAAKALGEPPPPRNVPEEPAPAPALALTPAQLPRIMQLRRRGWSIAGIARFLDLEPEAVEIALGVRRS